jgi:hypothetical protein
MELSLTPEKRKLVEKFAEKYSIRHRGQWISHEEALQRLTAENIPVPEDFRPEEYRKKLLDGNARNRGVTCDLQMRQQVPEQLSVTNFVQHILVREGVTLPYMLTHNVCQHLRLHNAGVQKYWIPTTPRE